MAKALSAEEVRAVCRYDVRCAEGEELSLADSIIGQERAIRSLRFGLDIPSGGFNIFVAGARGTGRTTAVRRFLTSIANDREVPPDYCYVNNFRNPYQPQALRLPAGEGYSFANDVGHLIEAARKEVPEAFQSDDYNARREDVVSSFNQKREELVEQLNLEAKEEGFVIQATQTGLFIVPVEDGKPLREQDILQLDEDKRQEIREGQRKLQDRLKTMQQKIQKLQAEARQAVEELDREVALYVVGQLFTDLEEKYSSLSDVVEYLEALKEDLLKNIDLFRSTADEQQNGELPPWMRGGQSQDEVFRRYEVNVLVDNGETTGAPVVEELNPTHNNLFGRIEKEARMGALATDFTLIRAGSLHKANGGFLLLPAEELLRNLFAWEGLKRVLKNEEIVIEEASERLGFMATRSLNPQAVPLKLKVVVVGTPEIYRLLHMYDPDFKELFKVKAEFTTDMECSGENVHKYSSFFHTLCTKEELPFLDESAVRKMVEHGSRLAGKQGKLSTRFADLADVVREAAHYVAQAGAERISEEHVVKTVDERTYRSNLLEERIHELIRDGVILIDTTDTAVGQVNGLSVLDVGDAAFGRPSRITATVGLGRRGLIDIEREAKLGGNIHSKGVMILSGFLTQRYGQMTPLSLTGRLVFEQSYGMVEGDSASSTELYALLSVLADRPIRQGLAVTGSVNQKGQLQSIGGVNEKIEGFYHVCKAKGLTGDQGVVIPASNQEDLMLKEEVVEAIGDGDFHVYACSTIDEGIEVLTGIEAGSRKDDGTYPPDSINGLVETRLAEMARQLTNFGKPDGSAENSNADSSER